MIQLDCSPREERKEHSIQENKNGCFRWAWLMNWTIWKLRNHIVYTEGIQGINHSNKQTVSFHQDNIDSFLVWSEPFYCSRKTCSQTCQPALLFYEMFRTRSSLLQTLLWRNQRQAPLRTQVLLVSLQSFQLTLYLLYLHSTI